MTTPSPIVITEDGSISCRDGETGELYHNRAGAYTEAWKNYYEPSSAHLLFHRQQRLEVLDVCFGLGYNTFVLLEEMLSGELQQGSITIVAVEKDRQILSWLPQVLSDHRFKRLSKLLHPLPQPFVDGTNLHRRQGLLEITLKFHIQDLRCIVPQLVNPADLIFHDPFSPSKVPQLWTYDLFQHYLRLLSPGGRILTYSSAAAVRGGLQASGFHIYRTQAVGGKSGGTLASKEPLEPDHKVIFPLDAQERLKLQSGSSIPYRDPTFCASSTQILAARQLEQQSMKMTNRHVDSF